VAVNGLPVVRDGPRVLADEVFGHFLGLSSAGFAFVLEHLAPANDSGVGRDFDKDPTVLVDERFEFGDFQR
jgi:hypothetical protein